MLPIFIFHSKLLYNIVILYLLDQAIGLMSRIFTNGSIPGRVIPKTQKMVLDETLLNTQHYQVRIKG